MVQEMEKELCGFKMDIFISVIGKMIFLMVKGLTFSKMEKDIKGN